MQRIWKIKSAKRYSTQFSKSLAYFKKLYGDAVVGGDVLYDGDDTVAFPGGRYHNWREAL